MIKARIKKVNGKYEVVGCPHYNTVKRKSVEPVSAIPELMRFWDSDKNTLNPTSTPSNSAEYAFWKCNNCEYEWQTTIIAQIKGTGKCLCCELYRVTKKGFTDLFTLIPEAINSYNFEKNKDIDIFNLPLRSTVPLWWKCPDCGCEWQASIAKRIDGKEGKYTLHGCQQCYIHSSERITPVSAVPKLVKFWNYKKNKERDINLTSAYLDEYAWWVCKNCGYEWQSNIRSRTNASDGCPCCDSERAINKGFNDVLTLVPEIAYIYDFDKNTEIDIFSLGPSSSQKVCWRCHTCGTEWESDIRKRINKDANGNYHVIGCAYCSNTRVLPGFNSLADLYPDVAKFWSPDNQKEANQYFPSSPTWVKWICPDCGSEYGALIKDMTSGIATCPYCDDRMVLTGLNSFADVHPDITKLWSSTNDRTPQSVFPNMAMSVKWICPDCGGEYSAPIIDMASGEAICPYCSGERVLPGFNSLADLYPEIAKLWSDDNKSKANRSFPNSLTSVKWNCPDCDGQFYALIKDMVSGDYSCPYCNDRMVLSGFNSFSARHKDLMEEWNYVNNYVLADADQISENSDKSVWWNCHKNCEHRYIMTPSRRLMYQKRHKEACPYCKGLRKNKRHFV